MVKPRDFATIVEAAATELACPVYLIEAATLPAGMMPPGASGYAWPSLHALFRDAIRGWRGPGVAVVIDVSRVTESVEAERLLRRPFANVTRLVELELQSTLVHELAHVIQFDWRPCDEELTPREVAVHREVLQSRCTIPPPAKAAPWEQHDARWLRAGIHFAYRLQADLPCGTDLAPERYGLSSQRFYERALADEPERLANIAIWELRHHAPPRSFRRLWYSDLLRWRAITEPAGWTAEHRTLFRVGLTLFRSNDDGFDHALGRRIHRPAAAT